MLALTAAVAAGAGALLAAGLPAHLLEPAHWDELREQLRSGMGGIEQARASLRRVRSLDPSRP